MAANADVQVGDLLTTSGVDGVYPPGLPVAKVMKVERKAESGFARITAAPAGAARRRAPRAGARAAGLADAAAARAAGRGDAEPRRQRQRPAQDHAAGRRSTPMIMPRGPTSCCCRPTRCSSALTLLRRRCC